MANTGNWDRPRRFMFHSLTDIYSNELYDDRGREIYDLGKAIEAAHKLQPEGNWEVYNGIEGHCEEKK